MNSPLDARNVQGDPHVANPGRESLLQSAPERLLAPPSADVFVTNLADQAQLAELGLAEQPKALAIITAVHDTTLGEKNDYGKTLGGTRVMERRELTDILSKDHPKKSEFSDEEVIEEGKRIAQELACDMTRKWLTLFRILSDNGVHVSEEEKRAAMMGGGKSVIIVESLEEYKNNLTLDEREAIYRAHGRHLAVKVGDKHITAVDMGTTGADMDVVIEETPYVACQSIDKGGTGNPSPTTAKGVWHATEAIMPLIETPEDQLSFSIQGVGQVGSRLAAHVLSRYPKATITISEKPEALDHARHVAKNLRVEFPEANIHVIDDPEAIYGVDADVFMPCAQANILTPETLEKLGDRVKVVVGAANDIYPVKGGKPDPDVVNQYSDRGVTVVPAPLANLGGILHVSSGWWAQLGGPEMSDDMRDIRAQHLVKGVKALIEQLLSQAQEKGITLEKQFDEMVAQTYARFCASEGIELS